MIKKSYNKDASKLMLEEIIPVPPEKVASQKQFTARIPQLLWERIQTLAEERRTAANTIVTELLANALADDNLPDPRDLLARALKGAEEDATAVYGNVPSELEKLSESIEKIRSQLEKLDEEINRLSSQGEFKHLRLRIAEREELRGKLALLEGRARTLEERARERDKYAAACYRARILRQIDHLEPLLRQRLHVLVEVLDVTIALLNELPQFRSWSNGLLYWIIAHLARESCDPNWARLLQGHLPSVGWNPERLKNLAELYAR